MWWETKNWNWRGESLSHTMKWGFPYIPCSFLKFLSCNSCFFLVVVSSDRSFPVFHVSSLWLYTALGFLSFTCVCRTFGVFCVPSENPWYNWTNLLNPWNIHILRYDSLTVITGANCPHDISPSERGGHMSYTSSRDSWRTSKIDHPG